MSDQVCLGVMALLDLQAGSAPSPLSFCLAMDLSRLCQFVQVRGWFRSRNGAFEFLACVGYVATGFTSLNHGG